MKHELHISYNKRQEIYWLVIKDKEDKDLTQEALPFRDYEQFRELISYLHRRLKASIYNSQSSPVPIKEVF